MDCPVYQEITNGLKMSLVGVAIGALAWFVAGSGVKEGYEKRKREREREAETRRREEAREQERRDRLQSMKKASLAFGKGLFR